MNARNINRNIARFGLTVLLCGAAVVQAASAAAPAGSSQRVTDLPRVVITGHRVTELPRVVVIGQRASMLQIANAVQLPRVVVVGQRANATETVLATTPATKSVATISSPALPVASSI